jgi:hypothetical protein
MSVVSQPCYECGRDITDDCGQTARVCIGLLPGGDYCWAVVDICPDCARRTAGQRRLWLAVTFVLVALLTFAIAYPLLP